MPENTVTFSYIVEYIALAPGVAMAILTTRMIRRVLTTLAGKHSTNFSDDDWR